MNKEIVDIIIGITPFLASSVGSLISWFLTKPGKEEIDNRKIKKNLYEEIRFRISIEISNKVPIKTKNISPDNYISQCSDVINNYLSANTEIVLDYYNADKSYSRFISYLRMLKYSLLISPVVGILSFVIPFIFIDQPMHRIYYLGITILLLIYITVISIALEKKRDKFQNYCSKYEIAE